MWKVIEFILLAGVVLLSITEFFYPIIMNKPLFGSFRKFKSKNLSEQELGTKLHKTKEKVEGIKEEIKEVQEEVSQKLKSVEQLKEESDQLFNPEK